MAEQFLIRQGILEKSKMVQYKKCKQMDVTYFQSEACDQLIQYHRFIELEKLWKKVNSGKYHCGLSPAKVSTTGKKQSKI